MNKLGLIKRTSIFAVALAVSVFAQAKGNEQVLDSMAVSKDVENYNEFRVVKWGPVTYKGEGKCNIMDLYQKSVAEGMGLTFQVVPDSTPESENYGLPAGGKRGAFGAKGKHAVRKDYDTDSTYLEVESIAPITYQSEGTCCFSCTCGK